MKKLLTVCAACMVAGMVSAQVESQNIVGYQTITTDATPKYELFGCNFIGVGGSVTSFKVNEYFAGSFSAGDEIQIMTPTGYNILKYYTEGLYKDGDWTFVDYAPGWGSTAGNYSEDEIGVNQGYWLKTANAVTYTSAGEVMTSGDGSVTTRAGTFELIACPYPIDLGVQTVTSPQLAAGDEIQIMTPTGYNILKYFTEGLYKDGDWTFVDYAPGWGSTAGNYSEDIIPSGSGFWAKTSVAATLDFGTW